MRRRLARLTAAACVGGAVALALAAPVSAHVEMTADKTQAGATDVTLTFHAEAESDSAGIRSERVVLPDGMAGTSITLVKAPAGWKLTLNPDGFTVAGKALPVGKDSEWAVKVGQLPPTAGKIPFKTIETYGNGEVSRWIEIPQDGQPEPDNPAPILTLRAAARTTAPTAPPTTAPPTTQPPAAATSAVAEPPAATDDGGPGWPLWVGLGVLVVLAAGGVVLLLRRRGRSAGAAG